MIIHVVLTVMLLINFSVCEQKTVSVIFKHRQVFGTGDIEDRNHIQLPDIHQKLLNIQDATHSKGPRIGNSKEIANIIDGVNKKTSNPDSHKNEEKVETDAAFDTYVDNKVEENNIGDDYKDSKSNTLKINNGYTGEVLAKRLRQNNDASVLPNHQEQDSEYKTKINTNSNFGPNYKRYNEYTGKVLAKRLRHSDAASDRNIHLEDSESKTKSNANLNTGPNIEESKLGLRNRFTNNIEQDIKTETNLDEYDEEQSTVKKFTNRFDGKRDSQVKNLYNSVDTYDEELKPDVRKKLRTKLKQGKNKRKNGIQKLQNSNNYDSVDSTNPKDKVSKTLRRLQDTRRLDHYDDENDGWDNFENDKQINHVDDTVVQIEDVNEICNIETLSCLNKIYHPKRTRQEEGTDLVSGNRINGRRKNRQKRSANEQWRNSLPGAKPTKSADEDLDLETWEVVTDSDLEKAKLNKYSQTMEYAGWTLLSAIMFIFIGICFIRDPIACIFAFGTGCPCCLICCPCIRSFTEKYLDTKKIVREQMNKYMPGIIVNDDGTLDYYEPTAEELDILMEIIDELSE